MGRTSSVAIKAIISAVDRVTGPIHRIAGVINGRLGGAFRALGSGVRAAAAKVTDWTVGAAKMAGVGAIALAGAVGMATKAYLDHASGLADLSAQVGFGVESMQELRYAFGMVGVSAEEVDSVLDAFSINVGRARAGTGRFAAFLGKVSPALLKQVKAAKSNEQAFDLVFQALAQIPDASRRAALAASAFGGAGAKIARLAGEGAEGLRKLREEFRATGAGLTPEQIAAADALGDNIDRLKASLSGVANALLSRLIPYVSIAVDKVRAWLAVNRDLIRVKIANMVRDLAAWIRSIDWAKLLRQAGAFLTWARDAFEMIGGVKGALKLLGTMLAINMVANLAAATASAWRFVAALLAAKAASAGGGFGVPGGAIGPPRPGGVPLAVPGGGAGGVGLLGLAAPALIAGGIMMGVQAIGERQQEADALSNLKPGERLDANGLIVPAPAQPNARREAGRMAIAGVGGLMQSFLPSPGAAPEGRVTVRFENAPPGLRVTEVDSNGLNVGASVGRRAMATGVPQ